MRDTRGVCVIWPTG